jgi:hypothetical protein
MALDNPAHADGVAMYATLLELLSHNGIATGAAISATGP